MENSHPGSLGKHEQIAMNVLVTIITDSYFFPLGGFFGNRQKNPAQVGRARALPPDPAKGYRFINQKAKQGKQAWFFLVKNRGDR